MAGAVLDAKGRRIHGSALASNNAIVTYLAQSGPRESSTVQERVSTVENNNAVSSKLHAVFKTTK